jgi:small-conductance mechanosensitive channel
VLRKLTTAVVARLQRLRVRPIRIQKVELISDRQIKEGLIRAAKAIRWFMVLAALYVYAPLVLSLFPWTREYAPRLIDYIMSPLRSAALVIIAYLPSLFVVIIIGVGAYMMIRISNFFFRELGNGTITWPGFYPEWADPTHKIVRFLILAVTMVVAFPYLPGSNSPAFRGISIFLGVLFSLGSTSAVANIIGGVILTYTRAFQIGDRVKIADTIGDVIEKTLLATRIRTIKNEFITVPNSMVLGSHIINFSSAGAGASLILHTAVSIGYDAPWRKVHELLIAAALRTPHILKEPEPFVLQTSLDDFYVTYEINAHTSEPAVMAVTYADLHKNIQDCFNESGVEIMSPHYASLRDGNPTAIPGQYLPKGYSAPVFRFEGQADESKAAE